MKAEEIKANLNKRVRYVNQQAGVDTDYILTGAIFRRGKEGFFYQAELQDLKNQKSILICSLDKIQAVEQEAS
jgi:hypothetical protein